MARESQPGAGNIALTTPAAWGVYRHLCSWLGEPVRLVELSDKKVGPQRRAKTDVAQFSPMGPGSTSLWCTVGGCDRVLNDGAYAEVLVFTRGIHKPTSAELLARILRDVLRSPGVRGGVPFREGLLVGIPTPPAPFSWWAGCACLKPTTMAPAFGEVVFKDGRRVPLWWLVPLHASELSAARTRGAAELVDDMARQHLDVAALDRPPVA